MIHFLPLAIGKDWWLPTNYAVHGRETDALFMWFFWITVTVLVLVQLLLVIFILRFRARPSHVTAMHFRGNNRLELFWTAVPAIIIASLAFGSEKVWHDYRSSPDLNNPNRSKILVIGQQFKWNVIYPGPDGEFGRYLRYPKPTDTLWPAGPDGRPITFANVPGPASLPLKQAVQAIDTYIDTENPLGKDFSDPAGKDDDWSFAPGRPIYVPVNRPVEVQLESKDVIHDFFIPNFRAQLYAVPGMRGRFVFTPTVTTEQVEAASRETISVDELAARLTDPANTGLIIDTDPGAPMAVRSIIKDQPAVTSDTVGKLKSAGIMRVSIHRPHPFEIACAQLCGNLHYTMRGTMIVLSQEEFDHRFPAAPHVR